MEFDSMSASFCFFFRFVGADLKSPNTERNYETFKISSFLM